MKRQQYTLKQTIVRTLTATSVDEALDIAADVFGDSSDYEVIEVDDLGPDRKEDYETHA